MKVVHISSMDVGGGAAIAACRHVESNIHNHIDAHSCTFKERE